MNDSVKFLTEIGARSYCANSLMSDTYIYIYIILSNGWYYVEEGGFIRSWETLVYEGLAGKA